MVVASIVVAYRGVIATEVLEALASQGCELKLVSEGNEGEARRKGYEEALGPVVLFTDADCLVPSDWVERHLAWHDRYDMVGGPAFNTGDIYTETWNQPKAAGGWGWNNLSVKKGMLEIPPIPAFSDAFAVKAFKGRKVYDSSIVVKHVHPLHSLKASFRKASTYGRAYRSVEGFEPRAKDILGVQTWKELRPQVSLPKWIFVRVFGFKLGEAWGLVRGGLVGR